MLVDTFQSGRWEVRRAASPLLITDTQLRYMRSLKACALIWLDPSDFLMLTVPSNDNDWTNVIAHKKVQELSIYNQAARTGELDTLPYLIVDMELRRVLGHEGRHRAGAVLRHNGNKQALHNFPVCVILKDARGIERYYVEHYPEPKRFLGFDDIPLQLKPQQWGSKFPSRSLDITIPRSAFDGGYEFNRK